MAMVGASLLTPASPALASQSTPAAAPDHILVMLKLAPPHFRPNSSYGGEYGDLQSQAARKRIAQGIARKNRLELVDSWPMPLIGVDCFVMRLPAGLSLAQAIAQVSRDPRVEWSQAQQEYRGRGAAAQLNDPLFKAEPAAVSWHLADLHRVATGRGVAIAIIDSKIEVGHPDLAGQFSSNQDFVGRRSPAERHGTAIAGVIGAKSNNGIGIAGIAPRARMMALRACWQTGSNLSQPTLCNSLSLGRALHYAIDHGAEVINLSLSGPPDALLARLIAIALRRRTSVVAAYDPTLPKGGFPASQPGVIGVVDESLQSWPSWLYGAPGRNVPTTQPGGRWYLVSGSSYAAAHVSGLIALVREERRSASPAITLARSPDGTIDACATLLGPSRECGCACLASR
jgi:hypothetical protein